MSPEEQRIAIAEAMGWHDIQEPIMFSALMATPAGIAPTEPHRLFSTIPDYLNDLNEMREVEETLSVAEKPDSGGYSERNYYASKLGEITYNDNGRGWQPLSNDDCFPICHATAAQRAEAFLRIKGLWKEAP